MEGNAKLAEHFKRWDIAVQTSVDILMNLDTFIQISRIRVKNKRKDTIVRESLMRVARCGLEMVSDYQTCADPENFLGGCVGGGGGANPRLL